MSAAPRGRPRHPGVADRSAQGDAAVERLASLVGLIDYASVYLALMRGVDPTPITAIDELKQRLR